MADNVTITAGAGTTIAADDIGGALHQRIKLTIGADGTAVDASAGAGAVGTGVIRTTLASDDPAVTSLALIDDAVFTDDAAFTPATSKGLAVGFQFDDVATDSVDEGDFGVARMSGNRVQYAQLRDAAGNERGAAVNASNQLAIAGPITVVSGGIAAGAIATGATSIAANEDTVSADADTGVKIMFKRLDTPANSSGTDGDYEQPQMSAGRVWASTIITAQVPGVGATNLGKAEDAVHADGDTGVMALSVRKNTAAATSGADGDYQPLITDTNGRLHTISATTVSDDAAFTPATTPVTMAGYTFDDVAPDSIDEGDAGAARMSANRNIYTTLRDAAGNERGANINASNQLAVAGPVTVASAGIASGAIASGAVASGAYASGAIGSGAVASGAYASGSIGSGAVASGAVASGAYASGALASGSIATGAIADMLVDDAAFTVATSRVFPVGGTVTTDSVDSGDTGAFLMTTDRKQVVQSLAKEVTITQTITRPANTTTYAINDALADTAATAGGDTVTSAAASSGGAGRITDVVIVFDEDAATPLQGEILLFDSAFTTTADNAAFALTDADAKLFVGKIPFILEDMSNNGGCHVQNLSIGFACVGTANLRSIIRVKNAYVPTTNSSVLTIRYKIIQA